MTPIPNLVFSTRSPSPKSGTDFIREVVAESPGIDDDVRTEFSRRADVAGSVLQRQLRHAIYMFCRIGRRDAWLFCRAVSLGLYRKGSNQLLVHGLVLAEEHLEALDGNPLLLDLPEVCHESGLIFLDEHPGSRRSLPELAFDSRVAALGRRLNRERLEHLGGFLDDNRFSTAYDALAELMRVGLIAPGLEPALVEALLLHFHPDDRFELPFHTFYSHSRPLDYRLLVVAPEDAQAVRGQFSDLVQLDLSGPPPEVPAASLGQRAARLRHSPGAYLAAVENYRLTYWSRRFMQPLTRKDASLCLHAALGEPTTPAEEKQLRRLQKERGQRGLRSRITSLADTWRDHPNDFPRRLKEVASTEDLVTAREVEQVLEAPTTMDERWCLVALLARDSCLKPGEDWGAVRRRAWRMLMPGERLKEFLDGLGLEQASGAEPILLEYALGSVQPDASPSSQAPPWEVLLAWMGRRAPIPEAVLSRVKATLARLRGEAVLDAWGHLQALLYRVNQPGEALLLFFSRILPLVPESEAASRVRSAVRWWLEHGDEHDEEVAPFLGQRWVAEQALLLLGDWFASQPPGGKEPAFRRLSGILAGLKELSASAGSGCGHLLVCLARSPLADRVPEVLDHCLKALSETEEDRREAFVAEALGSAARVLIPDLEGPCRLGDLQRHLQAVTALLAARNRNKATAAVDAMLLTMAVRGRVLAQEAKSRRLAEDAVESLQGHWLAFLRVAQVLKRAETTPDVFDRVQEWLELLQDELASPQLPLAETDPRFELFIRLAWWRWSAGQGRPGLAIICAKLRQSRTWGVAPASWSWLSKRMEEEVPRPLREQASVLLPPRPESRFFARLGLGERG